ncbi:hypothetical protein [Halocatena marina]|uniref:RanBP2-type domain-containing protein n=1 Tax=Halocatena marina TaxID=2934937 RepID=A0ABD5YU33_9EURY|nr:hypothetical protein [Halocatena marina]
MDWRCTNCGTSHPRNNPPCRACGGMDFEQGVVRLEWECTECSELVESPYEPCPQCGETSFDRLHDAEAGPDPVDNDVRLRSSSEPEELVDDFVWECANCGKQHMRNSPPCSRCGNARLEKVPFEATTEVDAGGSGTLSRVSLGLFEHTSSLLSLAGLGLAALGGLLVIYGGIIGAPIYQATQQIPPSAWMIILLGLTVGAVGAGFVLFDTRRKDINF